MMEYLGDLEGEISNRFSIYLLLNMIVFGIINRIKEFLSYMNSDDIKNKKDLETEWWMKYV